MAPEKNHLYYGDNYEVLQRYVKDESVDLVYLDPPFNSRQDYNVLFAEKDGSQSSSQIRAFEDTWEWNIDAERSYEQAHLSVVKKLRPNKSPGRLPIREHAQFSSYAFRLVQPQSE